MCSLLMVDATGKLCPLPRTPTAEPRPDDAPPGRRAGDGPAEVALATGRMALGDNASDGRPTRWAYPIVGGADERVLGVLELCPERPSLPLPEHQRTFEIAAHLAAVALVRHLDEARGVREVTRDETTGLGTRAMLTARLEDQTQRPVSALVVCHLGGLDLVRRTYGQETAGDTLTEASRRLQSVLRNGDLAFRTADDELAIALLQPAHAEAAVAVARKVANRFAHGVNTYGRNIFLDVRTGISVVEPPGSPPTRLIAEAELAVHRARSGNAIEVFRPEMLERVLQDLSLEAELRRALRNREFIVHYQPKVDLRTRRVVGAEALVRWSHPQRGLVPPSEFITALESSGLIVPVGLFVLQEACSQAAAWLDAGVRLETIQVNASLLQLDEPGFVDCVLDACASGGWEPHRLSLEITESVLSEERSNAQDVVLELSKHGVRFAIDDFGTGYSSIVRLDEFPVSELKIDRSFVAKIDADAEATGAPPLLAGAVAMAIALGLPTVAEGVETEHQARVLTEVGCDAAQGFHFSRPVPVHAFPEAVGRIPRIREK